MSFWCPFLELPHTTYHSNVRCLIKIFNQIRHVCLIGGHVHHGPQSCLMACGLFHGQIYENAMLQSFRPLTRCTPNIDQAEWPFTKKWMCYIYAWKGKFWKKKIYLLPFFLFSPLLTTAMFDEKKWEREKETKTTLLHNPLTFATRDHLLSLSPQNLLDNDNDWCRPKNRPYGDLKLHGHSNIFWM